MRPRLRPRRGVTLIELMVVVFIVALTLGLLLPALKHSGRGGGGGRLAQCQNNMRQLGLAMLNFSNSKNCYPTAGTFADDPSIHGGDPARSNIYLSMIDPDELPDRDHPLLSSWVIELLPYLDQPEIANAWDRDAPFDHPVSTTTAGISNKVLATTGLGVLRCPDDPTLAPGQGNLSYVVNGGFARWYPIPVGWKGGAKDGTPQNGDVLRLSPNNDWKENLEVGKKLGVMFLGTRTGDQPWDIKTTPAAIADGASYTLLIAENTHVGYSEASPYAGGLDTNWACPLPNFVLFLGSDDVCRSDRSPSDCLAGQLRLGKDGRDGPGWKRANQGATFESINYGQSLSVEGSFPFASSGHPGGANFVFCDGSTRYISATIDGTVYSKLITPAGSKLPSVFRQSPLNQSDFVE